MASDVEEDPRLLRAMLRADTTCRDAEKCSSNISAFSDYIMHKLARHYFENSGL